MKIWSKTNIPFVLLTLLLVTLRTSAEAEKPAEAKNCGCTCCAGKAICCCNETETVQASDDAVRHPLKGVIIGVVAEKSALLVKHEAIPGYMRAMTMLFKADAATLAAAVEGESVTATLVKRDQEFWLENVQVVPAGRK